MTEPSEKPGAATDGRPAGGRASESVTSARRILEYELSARGISLPPIPRTCVITYSQPLLNAVKQRCACREYDLGLTVPARLHFFDPQHGPPFSIIRGNPGAPMAAVVLEELIALGYRRFLAVGCAGHPARNGDARLPLGGVILPDRAYVYEGTSVHYGGTDVASYPDRSSVGALARLLLARGIDHRVGAVATTDAIYRETPEFISELLDRGVLGIDMELSALFTVAAFHGVEIAGLLFVSDVVEQDGEWRLGLADGALRGVERRLVPLILDFVADDETAK